MAMHPQRSPHILAALAGALVVLTAIVVVVVFRTNGNQAVANQDIRPSGIPSEISTSVATLMQLGPIPNNLAPGFTLTDQSAKALSLSQFRGKSVVLEFTDPHCTDVCPIVSQEIVNAYHDLGSSRSKVVFLSVNVNVYHGAITDMVAYTSEHGLDAIPTWHFVTGTSSELAKVWQSYGISVIAPDPNADIQHSDNMYFIDAEGHLRFLANPQVDHRSDGTSYLPGNQIASWGTGIALLARSLTQ